MMEGNRILRRLTIAASVLATTGCATVVKGTTQTVNVMTEPSGAACDMIRGNETIAALASTPNSVVVDKSVADITIRCRKDGHEEAEAALVSSASGWTAGNVMFGLLGGPIALGIDAASGAMTEYPSSVSIVLIPASFPSVAERDAFYDRIVEDIGSQTSSAIEQIRRQCRVQQNCDAKVKKLEADRDRRIAEMQSKRGRAAIIPTSSKADHTRQSGRLVFMSLAGRKL